MRTSYEYYEYGLKDKQENKLNDLRNTNVYPTSKAATEFDWIYAFNDKYPSNDTDVEKTGRWILVYLAKDVDRAWNLVKAGIKNGSLWKARVSKVSRSRFFLGPKVFIISVYTKDYHDQNDIREVLEYLEQKEIKAARKIVYYKIKNHEQKNGSKQKLKTIIYSSSDIKKSNEAEK